MNALHILPAGNQDIVDGDEALDMEGTPLLLVEVEEAYRGIVGLLQSIIDALLSDAGGFLVVGDDLVPERASCVAQLAVLLHKDELHYPVPHVLADICHHPGLFEAVAPTVVLPIGVSYVHHVG